MDTCSITCWLFRTLVIAATLKCSAGQCEPWAPASTPYSTKYVLPSSSDAERIRPLGFAPLTLYYDNNRGNPCVSLTNIGGTGRHIELLIEAEADMGFCVRINNGAASCESGSSTSCAEVAGDSVNYEFSCDSCEGSSVSLYYRFVVEELANDTATYDEDWCQKRSPDFPTSLLLAPDGNAPDPGNGEDEGNAGTRLHCNVVLSILSIIAWRSLL